MRWDCEVSGCFNIKRRPKTEVFADCFPGRISFGDVDGIVEIGGNVLLLEWKSASNGTLSRGQAIMHERLTTLCPITVFVVVGDPETMVVQEMGAIYHGARVPAEGLTAVTLDGLKARVRAWAKWAVEHPCWPPAVQDGS